MKLVVVGLLVLGTYRLLPYGPVRRARVPSSQAASKEVLWGCVPRYVPGTPGSRWRFSAIPRQVPSSASSFCPHCPFFAYTEQLFVLSSISSASRFFIAFMNYVVLASMSLAIRASTLLPSESFCCNTRTTWLGALREPHPLRYCSWMHSSLCLSSSASSSLHLVAAACHGLLSHF